MGDEGILATLSGIVFEDAVLATQQIIQDIKKRSILPFF